MLLLPLPFIHHQVDPVTFTVDERCDTSLSFSDWILKYSPVHVRLVRAAICPREGGTESCNEHEAIMSWTHCWNVPTMLHTHKDITPHTQRQHHTHTRTHHTHRDHTQTHTQTPHQTHTQTPHHKHIHTNTTPHTNMILDISPWISQQIGSLCCLSR